jgi:hypothetical protein
MMYLFLVHMVIHSWQGKFACREGTPYQLCYTAQAVMIEESSVCRFLYGDDGKSLGCMQISLAATRRIFPGYPKRQWRLLAVEDGLNISVGVNYLNWCIHQMGSWSRGVVCYNVGPEQAARMTPWQINHFPYLIAIQRYVWELERHEPGKD